MLLITLSLLLITARVDSQCGSQRKWCPCTTGDQLGPFYEPRLYSPKTDIAPWHELRNPQLAATLTGKIRDRRCWPLKKAKVEVWYAGTTGNNYTFSYPLWYRGMTETDEYGRYTFKATYPVIYQERPILHYHFKVTARGKEFVTQAYFEDKIPWSYQNYVSTRHSQFAKVTPRYGRRWGRRTRIGRTITYNINMDV